ncbi:MAG: GntR family transcriptional regulator [Bacteroidales bacterium]|nr:GntR family transcriptional regulator [Bacteroidales bacterium]
MLTRISIDENSSVPKYIQVVESIIDLIEAGKIKMGEKLPSINEAYKKLGISRDTLITAYDELKSRGVIAPQHGKGYYIANVTTPRHLKLFVLFDVMNGYKAILYRSLEKHLGPDCSIDIYFHHYNRRIFENLIQSNLGSYSHYVIMPHFNEDVSDVVNKIPPDKLLLIDKDIASLQGNYSAVFQDFRNDIYNALKSGNELLKKYKRLFMVVNRQFQFIPDGLVDGFISFSEEFGFDHGFINNIEEHQLEIGDVFILFTDNDLVELIKRSQHTGLKFGKDIGIISYDDTPLKEVLAKGITVISTDFRKMGQTAAQLILNRTKKE